MAKYVVVHPSLYMTLGGKKQAVAPGTELSDLTEAQIKKLGKKIKLAGTTKTVEVNKKPASK